MFLLLQVVEEIPADTPAVALTYTLTRTSTRALPLLRRDYELGGHVTLTMPSRCSSSTHSLILTTQGTSTQTHTPANGHDSVRWLYQGVGGDGGDPRKFEQLTIRLAGLKARSTMLARRHSARDTK